MSKKEILELLKLLSALESWALSQKEPIPDYLFEKMDSQINLLSDKVLEGEK